MVKRKLFGTDGIRGKANTYPLIPEMVVKIGKAAALCFKNGKVHPKFVIGKDTRITGYILESALTSGLCAMGADVILIGPSPTPAVAHLVKSFNADAGIVLTASHNPFEDNGIKFFSDNGIKLDDKVELDIEKMVFSRKINRSVDSKSIGKAYRVDDAAGRYIEFVKHSIINYSLDGIKVVIDCANGAAYKIAPKVFSELGAETIIINNQPDGLNINRNCGALHPESMGKVVRDNKADIGVAFDGDADRLIVVDEKGKVVDGDSVLFLIAKDHQRRNVLKRDTVVVTRYSNLGLDEKLREYGIKTSRVENGDRYVIDEMIKKGYVVGGEKSGHIILSRYSTTGDGIISALHLTKILKKSKKKMSEISGELKFYPQLLENIDVKVKKPLDRIKGLKSAIKEGKDRLGNKGRIFIRYSGTENVCRVMLEGKEKKEIKWISENIKNIIRKEVGV